MLTTSATILAVASKLGDAMDCHNGDRYETLTSKGDSSGWYRGVWREVVLVGIVRRQGGVLYRFWPCMAEATRDFRMRIHLGIKDSCECGAFNSSRMGRRKQMRGISKYGSTAFTSADRPRPARIPKVCAHV